MDQFLHDANLLLFKKRLLEVTDPVERKMLLKLQAEEHARAILGQSPSEAACSALL
jgi:hypothetical protein